MTLAVVGTDTGVGKTVITAALTVGLREDGADARAVKPVQTGFPDDDDAEYVRRACGTDAAATRLRTYREPLAPAVAARRADRPIDYDELLAETRAALESPDVGILEGAGGLRVPLSNDPDREILDLVADLGVPSLVVARSGLGTLNHTALTVDALRRRDVPVAGVVLNGYAADTVAERTNPGRLERMCDCLVWTVPEAALEEPGDAAALADELDDVHRQMGEDPPG